MTEQEQQRFAWREIDSAPRDGSHILVTKGGEYTTVVHWTEDNWQLSVNRLGEYSEYVWGPPTHWVPVPAWDSSRVR